MNNLMLDVESMGTGPDGALISIGAVFFDEDSGALGDTFYRVVNLATAIQRGAEMDASTVMWWLGQDEQARNAVRFSSEHIDEVLGAFVNFCTSRVPKGELMVWGCSPTFDCLKVERALGRSGLPVPWLYFNERCYRTVRDRNPSVTCDERTGLHNALDDAKFQALHLIKIRKAARARIAEKTPA